MGIDKDDNNQWSSDFPQDYPHRTGTSSSAGTIDSGDPYSTSGFSDDSITSGGLDQYNSFGEKNQDYLFGSDDSGSNSAKTLKMKNQKPWERDPSLGFSTSVYCCIVFGVNAGQGLLIGGLLGGIKAYADIQHGSGA